MRESLHTPKGPRARSLANFKVLTDDVLAAAAARAKRPFDASAVLTSGRRAGAQVATTTGGGRGGRVSSRLFVERSRRLATAFQQPPPRPTDPGAALIDLLGFADAVTRHRPPRPFEPLVFPALARLAAKRPRAPRSRGSHRE